MEAGTSMESTEHQCLWSATVLSFSYVNYSDEVKFLPLQAIHKTFSQTSDLKFLFSLFLIWNTAVASGMLMALFSLHSFKNLSVL